MLCFFFWFVLICLLVDRSLFLFVLCIVLLVEWYWADVNRCALLFVIRLCVYRCFGIFNHKYKIKITHKNKFTPIKKAHTTNQPIWWFFLYILLLPSSYAQLKFLAVVMRRRNGEKKKDSNTATYLRFRLHWINAALDATTSPYATTLSKKKNLPLSRARSWFAV